MCITVAVRVLRACVVVFYAVEIMTSMLFLAPREVAAQSAFAPGVNFVEDVVYDGLPVTAGVAFAPGDRIFLAIKEGSIRVAVAGKLLQEPFIDISEIVNRSTDRGLLAVAVHPEFPVKPFIYAAFVYDPPGSNKDLREPRVARVVRFTADAARDYNVALPGSMEVILGKNSTAENMAPLVLEGAPNDPEAASCMTGLTMAGEPIEDCIPVDGLSHSVCELQFGSDGALYASFGDGASYDGPSRTGLRVQNLDSMSGRVVRVNADTGLGLADNPFYDPAKPSSNRSRLWSYGLRNPFRMTLDPRTGQAYIGDVGTSYFEEVNVGKGANFGWPCYEGGLIERSMQEGGETTSLQQVGYRREPRTQAFCQRMYDQGQGAVVPPVFTYRHKYDENKKDLGASITGVAFYAGTTYPSQYHRALFIGDYAQRWIRYVTFDNQGKPTVRDFATELGSMLGVVQLLPGPDTNIYAVYLDLKTKTSQIRRFRAGTGTNAPPVVIAAASPRAGDVPLVVSFRSDGTYDPDGKPLSYAWDFGDGTSSKDPSPQHVYTQAGTFNARLTVSEVEDPSTSTTANVTIRTGVTPPKIVIDAPAPGTQFAIGDVINLSGRAEGKGNITLTWSVLQLHNQHEHLVTEVSGSTGAFQTEEHSDDTAYNVCLLARDDSDVTDQKCVVVRPQTVDYTFASSPVGATITYVDEGRDVLAPHIAKPVVNSYQTIVAAAEHLGRPFERWSDGITTRERFFVVGSEPQVFTAVYGNQPPLAAFKQPRVGKRMPAKVRFDARSSSDPDGDSLKFSWRFSDGTRASGPVVSKTFARRGRYRVILTVIDKGGMKSQKRFYVTVGMSQPPRRVVKPRLQLTGVYPAGCGSIETPCPVFDGTEFLSVRGSNLPRSGTSRRVFVLTETLEDGSWISSAKRPLSLSGTAQVPFAELSTGTIARMSLIVEERGQSISRSAYVYVRGED
jgi:glucose/arabinose dehydrogenase/PKD repeat protein